MLFLVGNGMQEASDLQLFKRCENAMYDNWNAQPVQCTVSESGGSNSAVIQQCVQLLKCYNWFVICSALDNKLTEENQHVHVLQKAVKYRETIDSADSVAALQSAYVDSALLQREGLIYDLKRVLYSS